MPAPWLCLRWEAALRSGELGGGRTSPDSVLPAARSPKPLEALSLHRSWVSVDVFHSASSPEAPRGEGGGEAQGGHPRQVGRGRGGCPRPNAVTQARGDTGPRAYSNPDGEAKAPHKKIRAPHPPLGAAAAAGQRSHNPSSSLHTQLPPAVGA